MMNLTDYIIIYLACGAPLAVYHFLQNRGQRRTKLCWIKTTFTFFLWFPLAINLLLFRVGRNGFQFFTINKEKSIFSTQKQIEAILIDTDSQISIYNFREIFERYIGLTTANYAGNDKVINTEKEIFRVSKSSNIKLAAVCQHRRNRKRLSFHQTLARQDFLNFVAKLSELSSDKKKLGNLSFEFVKLLNDIEAEDALEKMFATVSHTDKDFAVKNLEKDLWNPELPKPLPINPVSTQFQTMSAPTSLHSKD